MKQFQFLSVSYSGLKNNYSTVTGITPGFDLRTVITSFHLLTIF